jgi:hypothetical protein
MVRYIDPEVEGIHPLRRGMSDSDMADILEKIQDGGKDLSMEQIEAAEDYLFDYVAGETQNMLGVTTLQ